MAIFSLIGKLGLDGSGFHRELDRAGSRLHSFARTAAAGFGVGMLAEWTKQSLRSVASIRDLADRLNISTDAVQKLQRAGIDAGIPFEDLSNVIVRVDQARKKAGEGNSQTQKTFERLGVSIDDIQNRSLTAYDIWVKISKYLQTAEITPRLIADIAELAGRSTPKFLGLLKELAKWDSDFKPTFSEKFITQADKMSDRIAQLKKDLSDIPARLLMPPPEGGNPYTKGFFNSGSNGNIFQRFWNWSFTRPSERKLPPGMVHAPGGPLTLEDERKRIDAALAATGDLPEQQPINKAPLFEDLEAKKRAVKLSQEQFELQEKIDNLARKQLSPKEQELELQRKINALMSDAEAMMWMGLGEFDEDAIKSLSKATDLTGELAGLDSAKAYKSNLNQLQQIGGYAGNGMETIGMARSIDAKVSNLLNAIRELTVKVQDLGNKWQF